MKIQIIGKTGSGKSTLAKLLSDKYNLPVLFLDTYHWLPGWIERKPEEMNQMINDYLNSHNEWVIDGNYTKYFFERRLEEADQIIYMNFNRFVCLYRCIKRRIKYSGKSRESMTKGCDEKIDIEFILWILFKTRNKKSKERNKEIHNKYKDKIIDIKNQKELDAYINKLGLNKK